MVKVDFATFCWKGDVQRMHSPGFLKRLSEQHGHPFGRVILVRQNCKTIDVPPITDVPNLLIVDTTDHPGILQEYGIPEHDPIAEENCHGAGRSHYWKDHCVNHTTAAKVSDADYVVFSDSDITIERNGPPNWVDVGISVLERHPDVFIVCPNEGSGGSNRIPEGHKTQYISQQIFVVSRKAFRAANLGVPWNWPRKAPNQPFREFYAMLEGRMWRWMDSKGLHRVILNESHRYWHHNPTSTMWTKVL